MYIKAYLITRTVKICWNRLDSVGTCWNRIFCSNSVGTGETRKKCEWSTYGPILTFVGTVGTVGTYFVSWKKFS